MSRRGLWFFGALTLGLVLVALFARQLCPYDPDAQDMAAALLPPGAAHIAGTDRFGRDLFSRILMGLRTSVLSTLALVAATAAAGTMIGLACGYLGGWADTALMRLADLCLAFPTLVFALAIAALLGGGMANAVLALALVSWPKYARLARSQTLRIKNAPYMAAARLSGCTAGQLMLRHILPGILGPILVTAALDMGAMLMELAGLSFLGLGAQAPTAELGNMMSAGRSMMQTYPWVVLAPGAAIFLAVAVFNLLGDALRDALDPRLEE